MTAAEARRRGPSFRTWVSLITGLLVAVIIWQAWPSVVDAWHSLHQVDLVVGKGAFRRQTPRRHR